jgi:hypothetical protein
MQKESNADCKRRQWIEAMKLNLQPQLPCHIFYSSSDQSQQHPLLNYHFFSPNQVPKAPQQTKIKTQNNIEKEKDKKKGINTNEVPLDGQKLEKKKEKKKRRKKKKQAREDFA